MGTARPLRVVFGVTSSTERAATIEQLIATLGGRPVVLHHDFGKQPGLRLRSPNVHIVAETHETGWGTWGYCQAVLSTIQYALENIEFDYFQLLSPSCLPLRPIAAFEAHVSAGGWDGNMDLMEVRAERDVLMNYGWRIFAPKGTVRQRLLSRARAAYFGRDAKRVQRFGLSVLSGSEQADSPGRRVERRLAYEAARVLGEAMASGSPFVGKFRPYIGSLWFGASRALCERIVSGSRDPRIASYFSRLHLADESLFPTLIGNSGMRIGPSNHLINFFNDRGNPHAFKPDDLEAILSSTAFFARKFPSSAHAPIRSMLIDRRELLAGTPESSAAVRGARRINVSFGTVTDVADSPAVARLAAALQGRPLIVHQTGPAHLPSGSLPASVTLVPPPLTGGFRSIALNGGLLHLIKYFVECVDFDYLQLLPPDALPVRPIPEFEDFVSSTAFDAHAAVTSLKGPRAFARHADRVCIRPGSPLAPALRWLEARYVAPATGRSGNPGVLFGAAAARAAAALLPLRFRALRGLSPSVGTWWFGATREVCEHLVRYSTEPNWVDYATAIDDDGEVLFATLLTDGTFRVGPSNFGAMPDETAIAGGQDRGPARSLPWFASTVIVPANSAPTPPRADAVRLVAGSGAEATVG